MKKMISVLVILIISVACGITVYADMGVPEKAEYTVVTGINGVNYYSDSDSAKAGQSAGTLTGGQTFYVWLDMDDGFLRGTTDPKATSEQFEHFVYIRKSDVVDSSYAVAPETGKATDGTRYARTTGKLNVRCGPGTGFKLLKTSSDGTDVERMAGLFGYVAFRFR